MIKRVLQPWISHSHNIHQYRLPNLLFHISMFYAIARHCGVTLSKGDFDGFHSYPAEFNFT
ncbi:hypothetical protein BTJ40_14710 [Microbulbifer sp. A4B17]|uniref:DUF1993 family protein n=1 Tax=Microbulbifer sp. A4B17 TaxID=359370 RepID=UPI000D52C7BB|nr:hypothetical protein BTJ40_14710 [Microbulbifer sp. A4B17]